MDTIYFYLKNSSIVMLVFASMVVLSVQSCKPAKKDNAIEIVTNAMDFQMKDTIPSGWNTFRYINKSPETHFFLVEKYPEGKTKEDAEKEVLPVFQKGMDFLNQNKPNDAQDEFTKLPGWFSKVVFTGGCGLVSPNQSCEVSLKLDPGYYILECYVKNKDGIFHSAMGMTKALVVSDNNSDYTPTTPDIQLSISGADGIVSPDTIKKGKTTFAVYFKDQKVHENFVGHDMNLVRLNENYDIHELEKWMNWMDPKGLINPAPQGFTFLGGVNDSPAGSIGYFTADLEPGNYALISEVPNASDKGMLKTFSVSD